MLDKLMRRAAFLVLGLGLLCSCNNSDNSTASSTATPSTQHTLTVGPDVGVEKKDSVEIVSLLRNVYKWHDKNQNELIDFAVTTQDSFQTGIDYKFFAKTFAAIDSTGYFSKGFLRNYKQIGGYVNKQLVSANPKYFNEINFGYQAADPWTYFQDDAPEFWTKMALSDSASLKWQLPQDVGATDKYAVKFIKEDGRWKVSYMDGFDINKNYQ